MKRVLLTITGIQQIDDQKDKMELTTVGTFSENDECYIIRYKEEQEPPEEPISAKIRIYKDLGRVEMFRTGDNNSCLVIEKSKRNLCHYGTAYGELVMGVFGKTIEAEQNGDEGTFNFGYDIDINGSLASKNQVILKIQENQEQ